MLCNQYEHSSHDVLGFSQQRGVSQAVKARCVDAFTTFDARPKEMLKVLKREIPNKECLPSLDQLRNLKKNCIKTYQNSLELITKDDYIEFFKKHTVATKESYENLYVEPNRTSLPRLSLCRTERNRRALLFHLRL